MPEIDVVALLVTKATRKEPNERFVRAERCERTDVSHRKRAARYGEPVDDGVFAGGQLVKSVANELLERRGKGLGAFARPFDSHQMLLSVVGFADFERSPLEERVHHL